MWLQLSVQRLCHYPVARNDCYANNTNHSRSCLSKTFLAVIMLRQLYISTVSWHSYINATRACTDSLEKLPSSMDFRLRFTIIIYVLVFIFAKPFHCIDVSSEIATAFAIESNLTEDSPPVQPARSDGTKEPQDNTIVMQICNQTFPTPKGTKWVLCTGMHKEKVRTRNAISGTHKPSWKINTNF